MEQNKITLTQLLDIVNVPQPNLPQQNLPAIPHEIPKFFRDIGVEQALEKFKDIDLLTDSTEEEVALEANMALFFDNTYQLIRQNSFDKLASSFIFS